MTLSGLENGITQEKINAGTILEKAYTFIVQTSANQTNISIVLDKVRKKKTPKKKNRKRNSPGLKNHD